VDTPGDFGVRTPRPVHQELLDYLASRFMEEGWSIKQLHRVILLSACYQQSCEVTPAVLKLDPDNRLFGHAIRQRLDYEALRDTILALSGKLDLTMGGLPADQLVEPFSLRRTIYGFIDRQNLPGILRTFDFANPDTSNQGRFRTTVPQQALFLMNSRFVMQQARTLSQRPEVLASRSRAEQVQALYRVVYQRDAERRELVLGEKYLSNANSEGDVTPLERFVQVLLCSNELLFLD